MTGLRTPAAAIALAAALTIGLGACSGGQPAEAPPPSPQAKSSPAPAPLPEPVASGLSADWTAAPIEPGLWVYRRDARGSIALFGPANAGARLTLRCDLAARKLYLSRASAAPAPRELTIRATSGRTTVPARPTGSDNYIAAELAPSAPILDQLSFSRGRFAIEGAPDARLVVPAHPEFARVVEDCRG